jgi:hypothetical protein
VISLFDDPEWRAVHERIRTNARVGRREVIPPLVTEGDPVAMAMRTASGKPAAPCRTRRSSARSI